MTEGTIRMTRVVYGIAILVAGALTFGFPAQSQEDRPGQVFEVVPGDMPAPYATNSVSNGSDTVPRRGRVPEAPPGFTVTLFQEDIPGARNMLVTPDGTLVVTRSRAGAVSVLRDTDGDGSADQGADFIQGLARPHGLAFHDGYLWIADLERLYRVAWVNGAPADQLEAMSPSGIFGETSGHWTRNIVITPDGSTLYASIGSRGNIGEEDEPRATIQRYAISPDGDISEGETFAAGLRNPVGIAFLPGTERLFTVVNERDGMGDGLVPDYFTEVHQGTFYGWPYAYIGPNPQPGLEDRRPDLIAATIVPDVLIQSHSAPIGLSFLAGADVPEDWQDDALVTFRGSWNAAFPRGYKVVRIEFEDDEPTGRYVNFLTGFRVDTPDPNNPGPAQVWGRPVGVAVGPDGAIYIGDDTGGTIWRVTRN